jgi:hypothetical protein
MPFAERRSLAGCEVEASELISPVELTLAVAEDLPATYGSVL